MDSYFYQCFSQCVQQWNSVKVGFPHFQIVQCFVEFKITCKTMNQDGVCKICHEAITDLRHTSTLNHQFYFKKWEFNQKKIRKHLVKDRHGIKLDVEPERINNFNFNFIPTPGKSKIQVTPEQLRLHNKTITFKCKIKNNRKDAMNIMSINLLHPSDYFSISNNNFGINERRILQLSAGSHYIFKVKFRTDILTCASYKIPLTCDFQTVDDKHAFTMVRSFLLIVDDQSDVQEEKIKSPFTCQTWNDVKTFIPSTKEMRYQDRFVVPKDYGNCIQYILNELSGPLEILTKENYRPFWDRVLWIEELSQTHMLKKYNMQGVNMKLVRGENLLLEVPGLAEKRPSVIVGDFILIRISQDHTVYKGWVYRVNDTTVEISHVDDELIAYLELTPTMEMDVSFILGRLSFERMHEALERIVRTGLVDKLFPPRTVPIRNHVTHQIDNAQFFNQSICSNVEQKNAVMKILNCMHNYPYIVFGPPGTGKSITIVEAILQMKKRTKKRILVCAPANSACDMLATKLMSRCRKEELIRIHSTTRDRSTISEELKDYSNMEDDEFIKVMKDKLLSYRIVVTTLTLVGKFASFYHPDCVFIDEAAQASEPETDIAIALLSRIDKQVVLAGDPKQLGPITTDHSARFGLGVSLLERLMRDYGIYKPIAGTTNYDNNFITMLRLNFRSHPDILYIPNQLFYNDLLEPRSSLAQGDPIVDIAIYPVITKRAKTKGRAIEFCSVSAKDRREGWSPSFFNLFEAKLVVKYVRGLLNLNTDLPEVYQVRPDQIGIVTPYKRQVHKIKEYLRHSGFEGIEVGTTESFQGREKRIIIISTVRAQHSLLLLDKKFNLGFVKHDKRFNVALTRAISKLVVIGCPLVLRTDPKWEKYINLSQSFGTYFGNSFAEDDQQFRTEVVARMSNFRLNDDQYNNS